MDSSRPCMMGAELGATNYRLSPSVMKPNAFKNHKKKGQGRRLD